MRLWSRLGNDKTAQFPEIARALADWGRSRREPVVLDGEIVALNADGEPAGFQNLQGRIHLKELVAGRRSPSSLSRPSGPSGPSRPSRPSVAFIAFDVLRDGQTDLRNRPLTERRAVLERLLPASAEGSARLAAAPSRREGGAKPDRRSFASATGRRGRALHERALASGWEGLIAKRAVSRYVSGKRSSDWRKLKIHQEQEFVIGGWTEPRQSRTYFGALVLGVFDRGALTYAGHVGTGFNERELQRLMRLMKPIEIATSPFASPVPTNERPHWVEPTLVAQVRFTEWTADGILRHPVYLGLRDDKKAADVTKKRRRKRRRSCRLRAKRYGEPRRSKAKAGRFALHQRRK